MMTSTSASMPCLRAPRAVPARCWRRCVSVVFPVVRRSSPAPRPARERHAQRRCRCSAHGAGDGPGRVRGSQQDDRNTDEDDLRGEARDPRYRSFDLASPHAWEARRGFLAELQQGTSFLRLADAALWAAAEDDALATNSPVRLPVDAFKQRLARLADNCGAALAAEGARRRETGGEEGELSDEEAVAVVMECVLGAGGLRVPDTGKSSVPGESVVAHPGVWERSSHAYLNQVLCNRVGTPASLAIVLIDVFQRLLVSGALSCGVIVDCEDFTEPPTARPAPGFTREALVAADGRVANTCTTDALCEVLRTLKRAFWPFAWESNVAADPTGAQGGFEAAARTALEGDDDATTEAISRFAKYRLKRGIYTSTGAGDLRRCVPACERLVLLCGDSAPWERRDLGVMYLHAGRLDEALAELREYRRSEHARRSAAAERELVDLLLALLQESGVQPCAEGPLCLERELNRERPEIELTRRAIEW